MNLVVTSTPTLAQIRAERYLSDAHGDFQRAVGGGLCLIADRQAFSLASDLPILDYLQTLSASIHREIEREASLLVPCRCRQQANGEPGGNLRQRV